MKNVLNNLQTLQDQLNPKLDNLALELYHKPELGDQEFFAMSQHVALLREYGFEVQEGLCGKTTGFYAAYASKKPGLKVAFLAEYDALPDIGHACGHNLLGAVSSGAGILLKSLVDEAGGTVVVIGTPAEETNGAKPHFVSEGVFNDIDLVLMAHPADMWLLSGDSLALMPLQFEFFGKGAHAGSEPELGLNALNAGIITMNAIDALRGHIRSTSRIAGIILDGGKAANIVPDYCRMQFYVRSTDYDYNSELSEKVRNCARAGALATGTRLEITQHEVDFMDMRTNKALSDIFSKIAFEEFGIRLGEGPVGGSSDIGNVSYVCPTIHPYFDISGGRPCGGHTKDMADCSITPYAFEQAHKAAALLALTAYECISNPESYKLVKDEFLSKQDSGGMCSR